MELEAVGAELRDRGTSKKAMTDDDRCAPRGDLPKPCCADSQDPTFRSKVKKKKRKEKKRKKKAQHARYDI